MSEGLDIYEAVRVFAARSVVEETPEFQLREVYRWYARTYGITPLAAEQIPMGHLLRDFYECQYRDMEPQQLDREIENLLMTEKERAAKEDGKNLDSVGAAEFERKTLADIAAQKEAQTKKEASAARSEPAPRPMREVGLEGRASPKPVAAPIPEGISVNFALPEDLGDQAEDSLVSFMARPKD